MRKIPNIRWIIAGMLFLAAILNYVDRQTLSILAPTIQKDLKLDDAAYGHVVDLFLIAYTISLLVSGRLVDKLGSRFGMALFVTWWSISNVLTAFAHSAASLGMFRFMLGFGEAGNWPSSTKAVSEWFSPKERAFAVGLYTMGATLGATIAPILILFLVNRWHWQAAFVATGLLGLVWVLPWIWLYRPPEQHPRITEKELLAIRTADAESTASAPAMATSEWGRWADAFSRREVWLLMFARMLTDPLWFFYQFWFAKYLFTVRNLDQQQLKITWVIYLAADIGSLTGGLLSGYFIKRGMGTLSARMIIMLVCASIMPLSPLITTSQSLYLAIGIGMLAVFAHLAWLANITAMVVDVIPRSLVATCFGIVAAGSAVGGIIMNKVVVYLVQNYSYAHWFLIMAALHPIAWLMLWAGGLLRGQPSKQRVALVV